MKKIDFNDLAARMEAQCGDWENEESLSENAKTELMEKIEALEKQRNPKELKKNGHFPKKKRYLFVLAAALVLLMGIGAIGERVWTPEQNELERGSEISTKVNNEEKENVLREEEAIFLEIKEKLGISPLRFGYLPEGMVLDRYVIGESTGWAYLYYLYDGKIISVQMLKRPEESSSNVQWDGAVRKLEGVSNEYGYEIEAFLVDEENKNYGAKILYGNAYYDIIGSFEDENEFLSILRGIFFKNL